MAREFMAKLAAEEQAKRAAASQAKSNKRGSGGIFSWLSLSKKNKAGDSDEDDSEDE
jgi:hypothetical protein